jgi:hypothetical protein
LLDVHDAFGGRGSCDFGWAVDFGWLGWLGLNALFVFLVGWVIRVDGRIGMLVFVVGFIWKGW